MGYKERKEQLTKTFKPREEWWSRVFATPIAGLILSGVADWQFITPNRLTVLSFILTILTAVLILSSSPTSLLIAGIVLQLAYIIDCMDGQLARYRQSPSKIGSFFEVNMKIRPVCITASMPCVIAIINKAVIVLGKKRLRLTIK